MKKLIIHNPNNLPLVKLKDLEPLQGDLKDLSDENYKRLRGSLLKHGWQVPAFIYEQDGIKYIVDAHQRQRVAVKEGWGDMEVPCVNVTAKSIREAKEILLKVSSQYGTITVEGLDEFYPNWQDLDVKFDKINVDFLNKPLEELESSNNRPVGESLNDEELRDSMSVILIYGKADFIEVNTLGDYFKKKYGVSSMSDVVMNLMREAYEDNISS